MLMPEKVTNFNLYGEEGTRFLGLASEITLPNFETLSEEIKGAGLAGSYDSPTPGHFGAMTMDFSFNTVTDDAFKVYGKTSTKLTLRAAQQSYDASAGAEVQKGLKIVFAGRPKGLDGGKIAVASTTGTKVTVSISYFKAEIDGKEIIEWDFFNNIFRVNGVDQLAEVNKLI